jgi:hypothetical protein
MPVNDGYKSLRLPEIFMAKLRRQADQQQRSIAKQVIRWCQLGAAVESNPQLTGQELLDQYSQRKDAVS